jgi:hypothetical protein
MRWSGSTVHAMGAGDAIPMPNEVKPGETVDITVRLTAPTQAGTYQTYYRLRNAQSQFFRLDGSGDLWLKIISGQPPAATNTPASGTTNTPEAAETATETPAATPEP